MTCVVPELEPVFQTVCQRYFGVTPLEVGVGTRTGLKVLYDTPRDVGADRVVDAIAAIQQLRSTSADRRRHRYCDGVRCGQSRR